MKIAVILGARKGGNTHTTSLAFTEEMKRLGYVQPQYIFLRDYELKFCLGCRICFDKGEHFCPRKDDLLQIVDIIKHADGVIFASPVYMNDVSGEMKTLIDRMAFLAHRPAFFEKCSFIITTAHAAGNKHARQTLGAATFSWGFHHVGSLGLYIPTVKGPPDLTKYQNRIQKSAKMFYEAIAKQTFKSPSLLALMTFKIQQRSNTSPRYQNTLDYTYWKQKGFSNPNKGYFIATDTVWIKKKIASLMGSMLLRYYG